MKTLCLVADDLTGALDSTAPFCTTRGAVPVFLDPAAAPRNLPAAAFDLATRDADAVRAVQANLDVLDRLREADVAFKKIDSLLRGHWAAELAALLHRGAFGTCILAPAFPAQGRITAGGRQVLRSAGEPDRTLDVDPGASLRQKGLAVRPVAGPHGPWSRGPGDSKGEVVLVDADTDAALQAIVRWGADAPAPVLWCGSGGLARALAGPRSPSWATSVRQPVLAIVGSDHAVSRAQVAQAIDAHPQGHALVDDDAATSAQRVAQCLARDGRCLVTFAIPPGTPAADASRSIRARLGLLLGGLARPATLFVSGGETLLSVCHAVRATHLAVTGEYGPGVARARLGDGAWPDLDVISKSGAFGSSSWLRDLMSGAAGD